MLKPMPSPCKTLFAVLLLAAPAFAAAQACPIDPAQVARGLGIPMLRKILTIEAADCQAMLVRDDGVEFHLPEKSTPVNGGIRAEAAIDFPFVEGDTVRYAWEMRIPPKFHSDAPQNRWWSLAQWHDQPDRRTGQTWAELPKRPPPLSLFMEERADGVGIGLRTFDAGDRSWSKWPLGEWLRIAVTIRWSRFGDGAVDVEVAGHPEFSVKVTGPNMYNDYQHYLKLGQYRHPDITADSSVFFRHLQITKTGG